MFKREGAQYIFDGIIDHEQANACYLLHWIHVPQ
jgi:hypothetical protein